MKQPTHLFDIGSASHTNNRFAALCRLDVGEQVDSNATSCTVQPLDDKAKPKFQAVTARVKVSGDGKKVAVVVPAGTVLTPVPPPSAHHERHRPFDDLTPGSVTITVQSPSSPDPTLNVPVDYIDGDPCDPAV
jgi:hypothetical protein